MARNIEIKARVPNALALRERVIKLSDGESEVLNQRDTFYKVAHGRLKLREFGDGTAELIYYERPHQAGPKLSSYTRTRVPEAALMHELLRKIFGEMSVVAKRREVFLVGRTRIHLDEVEQLGSFLELEVVLADNKEVTEGNQVALVLMKRLEIRPEDLVEQAYVELLEVAKLSPKKFSSICNVIALAFAGHAPSLRFITRKCEDSLGSRTFSFVLLLRP